MMDNFLNPEDWVSVVSFYGDTEIIYTASQLSTNRDAIVEAVQNIELKQGTDIGAGLKMFRTSSSSRAQISAQA